MNQHFLPLTKQEIEQRNWSEIDIVLVTGDAYVDHPSFGVAVIGRVLENKGYRVGIIAMPDWKDPASITVLGKPRLFFGVTSGNVDSMLANYTAFKKRRSDDPYTPDGKGGAKPARAVIVYCNLIKSVYKDTPIVIGGLEASMRRIAHYDFWSDTVRRSIIEDTRADILVYGMGEQAIVSIAQRIAAGQSLEQIPGTVIISTHQPQEALLLPAEEEVMQSKKAFLKLYKLFYRHHHRLLAQPSGKRFIVHHPPASLNSSELDQVFDLPYSRMPHPGYQKKIPAFDMICNSITAHRGCVSGCSFCSLTLHQGKRIVSRSPESVLREIEKMASLPYFKGHVTDIGGPTANMYGFDCSRNWQCPRESCTFPDLCPNLQFRTLKWAELLEKASSLHRVKQVTVGSGIRYDVLMCDPHARQILKQLIKNHISGQMKIAPEHTNLLVLRAMRKTPISELSQFIDSFRSINKGNNKQQHLLPYLMSNHPGCRLEDMMAMKKEVFCLFQFIPQQVQSFIPLPMTLSSVIYYTGCDSLTDEQFFITQSEAARRKQHRIFFRK